MKNLFYLNFLLIILINHLLGFSKNEIVVTSRYNYYTVEDSATILINLPKSDLSSGINIQYQHKYNGYFLVQNFDLENNKLNSVKIPISNFENGEARLQTTISFDGKNIDREFIICKLPPKSNGVKIDRKTGRLVIEDYSFFPFGFYCYSPVQPGLAQEEIVKGFNMMSPYQQIDRKNRQARKKYMDRCAELGMKVHYNLCSVAGGGGAGSHRSKMNDFDAAKLLEEEVEYFKDHPALLGWYISDEPVGQNVSVDIIQKAYDIVKRVDPYHPISVVFMTPHKAVDYRHAMDIVMTDPYPVPDGNILVVGDIVENLQEDFYLEKPIWIVPQAFGGGEQWKREPTSREIRLMTYLAIVNDAKGVQYFIRHGLNSFPKSTVTWNECGKIALEIAEISPYLLNYDFKPKVIHPENIKVNCWQKDNKLILLAVNTFNQPKKMKLKLDKYSGSSQVLFENRDVKIEDGILNDLIDGYGIRIYKIDLNPGEITKDDNIAINPGFENNPSIGIVSGCYARVSGDPGCSYFSDSEVVYEGEHSLRISTSPKGNVSLSFYKSQLVEGSSYNVSIMAKSSTQTLVKSKKRLFNWFSRKEKSKKLKSVVSMRNLGKIEFTPTRNWEKYSMIINCPAEGQNVSLISPGIIQSGEGRVWYDCLEIVADPKIHCELSEETGIVNVELSTSEKDVKLRYCYDSELNSSSQLYKEPLIIDKSCILKVGVFKDGKLKGFSQRTFNDHKALGKYVKYKNLPAKRYFVNENLGLTDGIYGSKEYRDGCWHGIEEKDLDIIIDLGELTEISEITTGFLQTTPSWIFMPEFVEYSISEDGREYKRIAHLENDVSQKNRSNIKKLFKHEFEAEKVRFIKVYGKNIGTCPLWHRSEGGKAFMFIDEVIVN